MPALTRLLLARLAIVLPLFLSPCDWGAIVDVSGPSQRCTRTEVGKPALRKPRHSPDCQQLQRLARATPTSFLKNGPTRVTESKIEIGAVEFTASIPEQNEHDYTYSEVRIGWQLVASRQC